MMSRSARRAAVVTALGVFAASVYLLVTASPVLVRMAIEPIGLPLGNLTTWAGIVALPTASWLAFSKYLAGHATANRFCRAVMLMLLVLAAAWGLVSFGLAGNWAFNFSASSESFRGSGLAGEIFRIYTVSIIAITLLWSLLLLVLSRAR